MPVEYDNFHYQHQIPGGMLSNFREQLRVAGLGAQIRRAAGGMRARPRGAGLADHDHAFSQFVGTQAVFNVIHGERYAIVPNEVKKYVLGYYGKLLGPVDPNVYDRIVANGAKDIPLEPKPLEPLFPCCAGNIPRLATTNCCCG